jgi:hypothetical protein
MGRVGGTVSSFGKVGLEKGPWDGIPIFARSFFEGCLEIEEETPPRLKISDLQNPENFHERLAAFLMKQQ